MKNIFLLGVLFFFTISLSAKDSAKNTIETLGDICTVTISGDCDGDGEVDISMTVDCEHREAAINQIQSFCA